MTRIYADHAAFVPPDPRVVEYGLQYLNGSFGNPASIYTEGIAARAAVEEAREKVARLINAEDPKQIIFTSGATESNNLAITGTALRNKKAGIRVAASAIEHISVVNPTKDLQKKGYLITRIPVDRHGTVSLDAMDDLVTPDTVVTSVQYANNEIGTVEPIRDVARVVHDRGQYLHVDAADAAGRIPIDVQKDGIDLCTLSGNQLGGLSGTGALYVGPAVRLQPVIFGGGQERGLRSGTEDVFGIACMGEAARFAEEEMAEESGRLQTIRDGLIHGILTISEAHLTGHPTERLPHHASFRLGRIEGESIQLSMDLAGIAVGTGSACTSMTLEASHVLLAIGLAHDEAHGSLVLTLGRSNRQDQIPTIIGSVRETVKRLRAITPL